MKYFFGYTLVVVLFSGLAFYAYLTNTNSYNSSNMIAHSHQVLYNIEEIMTLLADIETGQRGYSLTSKEEFLEPAVNAKSKISNDIQELKQLVIDHPGQLGTIDTLENLIRKKIIFTNKAIALSKSYKKSDVVQLLQSLEGKNYMDGIRSYVASMQQVEKLLLSQRLEENEKAYAFFQICFFLFILAFLVIVSILFFIIIKNNNSLKGAMLEVDELYNGAPCGYHSIDKSGKIISINNTELSWIGYTREEILGKNIDTLLKSSETSEEEKALLTEQGWEIGMEYQLLCKNGSTFPVIVDSVAVKDSNGNSMGTRSCLFDNSKGVKSKLEILHLNKELKKNVNNLEMANLEIESFAYSVSHDLRAPLRAITGYNSIFKEEYGNTLDAEGQRLLEVIDRNTIKMGHLIDDLLMFSQISKKEILKINVDMDQLVRSAVKLQLEEHAQRHKVQIEILDLGRVPADAGLINQVWNNLISNALKFSNNKENQIIKIGRKIENGLNVFYVEDNGVGFDMLYANKLFGVFQRLHKQKEFEGNGVGLAIVQRIIRKHGGKVWANSVLGEGACFYFTLPNNASYEE